MVKYKKARFVSFLERRARELLVADQDEKRKPDSDIRDRIALTLDQIEVLRRNDECFLESIIDAQTDVGTQLLQLSPLAQPAYLIDGREKLLNKKLHERLRGRLIDLESEKRKRQDRLVKTENQLQRELLELIQEHEHLANQRFD